MARSAVLRQVLSYIREHDITEYADLMGMLLDGGNDTAAMWECAADNVEMVCAVLDSIRRQKTAERWSKAMDYDGTDEPGMNS